MNGAAAKVALDQYARTLAPHMANAVAYQVNQTGPCSWQCIVALNLLDGAPEFAGEICSSPIDSQGAAAIQAMQEHGATLRELQESMAPAKKEEPAAAPAPAAPVPAAAPAAPEAPKRASRFSEGPPAEAKPPPPIMPAAVAAPDDSKKRSRSASRSRSKSRKRSRSRSRRDRRRRDRSRSRSRSRDREKRRSPSRRRRSPSRGYDRRKRDRTPPGGVSLREWGKKNTKAPPPIDPTRERWRCYRCPGAVNYIDVNLKCHVCGYAGPGAKKEPQMAPASIPAPDAAKMAALAQLSSKGAGK